MPITDFLERNAREYGDEIALIEINPQHESHDDRWTEYSLVESAPEEAYRREISWMDFDRRANRFANLLLANGVRRGDKVAVLLMNCL